MSEFIKGKNCTNQTTKQRKNLYYSFIVRLNVCGNQIYVNFDGFSGQYLLKFFEIYQQNQVKCDFVNSKWIIVQSKIIMWKVCVCCDETGHHDCCERNYKIASLFWPRRMARISHRFL